MPCNSDYLEPSIREAELSRAAGLLVFALEASGRTPEPWARKEAANLYASDERIVPELCALIRSLGDSERDRIVYDAKSRISRDLADWWEEHEQADREREERERAAIRKAEARKSAAQKLTEEELEALGIGGA